MLRPRWFVIALLISVLGSPYAHAQSTSPLTGVDGTLNLDGSSNTLNQFLTVTTKAGTTNRNARFTFGGYNTAPGPPVVITPIATDYFAIGTPLEEIFHLTGDAKVGFGVLSPQAKFHVQASSGTQFLLTATGQQGQVSMGTTDVNYSYLAFNARDSGGGAFVAPSSAQSAMLFLKFNDSLKMMRWTPALSPASSVSFVAAFDLNLANGNVGIGTSASTSTLDVGAASSSASSIHTTGTINAGGNITSVGTINGGNITSVGTINAGGSITSVGTINAGGNITSGGDITATGAIFASYSQDVAEWVPSTEALTVGTVVVLDKSMTNHVQASTTAYDSSVAGVISGKPGIILGRQSAGDAAVATTGRVPVKVDATVSPIAIGDLLVTSDIPGVAMKSMPMQLNGRSFHQPGTIIGKALEPLASGTGEILVLLSLQ
jgi:hypothetical protein